MEYDYQTSDCGENVIEFLRNQKTATVSFSQPRYVNRIRDLAKNNPDDVEICAENEDGSITAHIPTSWVRIIPPRKVDMSEERKEELRERLAMYRERKENR